jgi:hypothetical protein
VVTHFQHQLLQRLLGADLAPDLVELAADALLPLLLAEPGTYTRLAGALVGAHSGDQRTAAAMQQVGGAHRGGLVWVGGVPRGLCGRGGRGN